MDIPIFIYEFIIRKIIIAGRKLELAQAVDVVAGKTRREVEFKCSAALELKCIMFSQAALASSVAVARSFHIGMLDDSGLGRNLWICFSLRL